jgi:membrane-associated phospholipid phosphatase
VSQLSAPALKVTPFTTELLSPQWQQRGRTLVGANTLSPAAAGRVYAALSVAQYRAVVAADEKLSTEGTIPAQGFSAGGRSRYETLRGAVSGASVEVLSFLFPAAASSLEEQVTADANAGVGGVHPGFALGLAIGRAAGIAMKSHLQNDGSTLPWTGTLPVGPGFWTSTGAPGAANLGGITPYLVNSTSQFRSAPPPAWGSPAFEAALNEVLTIAQNRTAEQVAIAQKWATAGGPSTPPGYWNQVAATYIAEAKLSERAATHVFALMNAAQFDALLTCFETKYHYFVIRPSQAEPLISLVVPNPNYPAYPSGHACVSSSAAHVLKHFFPAHATELTNLVTEAGLSRLYAGIHYLFDMEASWILGPAVAQWAIDHEDALR